MFKLADVVQPFSEDQIAKLTNMAIRRILQSEKAIAQSGMSHVSLLLGACHLRYHIRSTKSTSLSFYLFLGPCEAACTVGDPV